MKSRRRKLAPAAVAVLVVAVLSGCSDSASSASGDPTLPTTVRLGYFPNLTHAPALVGIEQGLFESSLGENRLETKTFNAGPEATEALLSGAIDATFIGPNPAINAFAKSQGGIRIVAGATSGGARLIVKPGITGPRDLLGRTLATPQLGGTQDVALRWWLKEEGLETSVTGGGDVSIQPQENSQTLEAFRSGAIDGAWVPEPWGTRMIDEGDGVVLVNEADLWPEGRFVTTHLIVSSTFAEAHPDAVRGLVQGLVESIASIESDPAAAQAAVAAGIKQVTGKDLSAELISSAWKQLTFTADPIASSLQESAEHAAALGLPTTTDLDGIYDLSVLNRIRRSAGQDEVAGQ